MTAAEELLDLRQQLADLAKHWKTEGQRAIDTGVAVMPRCRGPVNAGAALLLCGALIEQHFLQPKASAVAEPVFAYGEREY